MCMLLENLFFLYYNCVFCLYVKHFPVLWLVWLCLYIWCALCFEVNMDLFLILSTVVIICQYITYVQNFCNHISLALRPQQLQPDDLWQELWAWPHESQRNSVTKNENSYERPKVTLIHLFKLVSTSTLKSSWKTKAILNNTLILFCHWKALEFA